MRTGVVHVAAKVAVRSDTPVHAAAWAQELALAGLDELGASLLCMRGVVPRGAPALVALVRQASVAGVGSKP